MLVLDAELREQLESLANSRSLPAGLVRRAKNILLSASGKTNRGIARQLETSKVTVSLWRCRFLRHDRQELDQKQKDPARFSPAGSSCLCDSQVSKNYDFVVSVIVFLVRHRLAMAW